MSFARRFFPARYFPPRYFPGGIAVPIPPPTPEPESSQEQLLADALAGVSGGVRTRYRAVWLSSSFIFLADISSAIEDCWITCDNNRQVARDGRLIIQPDELPEDFDSLTDYIAITAEIYEPVQALWLSFPLGTFALDDPEELFAPGGYRQWSVSMADPGVKITTTRLGGTVTFAKGTNYVTAIEQLLDHFGVTHEINPTDMVLPTDVTYPWQTYYATAIKELCDGISYYYPLADKMCVFRSEQCLDPDGVPVAIVYSSLVEPKMVVGDVWRRSLSVTNGQYVNRAIGSCEDPARTPITVQALNNDPTSPVSRASTGNLRSRNFRVDRIFNKDMLYHYCKCRVREAAASAYRGQLQTFFDPRRDIRENYLLTIDDIEVETKWRVQSWTCHARAGENMMHYLGRVQPIEVELSDTDVGEPDF